MITEVSNRPDCWKCTLNVEWHDCTWCPSIAFRRGIEIRRGDPAKPLPAPGILPHPVRRQNLVKPMNTFENRKSKIGNSPAFTLVELLTVIAIIGILAAMLLTGIPAAIKAAKKAKAKTEISQLVTAIEAYDAAYSRFPISPAEQAIAGTNDFTTGLSFGPGNGSGFSFDNNSNVVAILMDMTVYPNGVPTVNAGHQKNPKQTKFLNAKMVSDNTLPGVGTDGVYRDPWGNPYIITMNTSYNEQGTRDLYYSLQKVSQEPPMPAPYSQTGYNGLFNPDTSPTDNYLFHGKVMVWSAGPDKEYDPIGASPSPANTGKNKDNVISW